jgi:hypothetical protein
MIVPEITLYQIAKEKFGDEKATEFVSALKDTIDAKFKEKESVFLTKDDKVDIMRSIYTVGIIQFLAIVGSVLVIVNFKFR